MTLGWIVGSTFLISLIAWIGILKLFLKDELMDRILLVLVALAAGGLIGGAFLHLLLQLNRDAHEQLECVKALEVVEGAGHLFEGPGELEVVADLAAEWFSDHLK